MKVIKLKEYVAEKLVNKVLGGKEFKQQHKNAIEDFYNGERLVEMKLGNNSILFNSKYVKYKIKN